MQHVVQVWSLFCVSFLSPRWHCQGNNPCSIYCPWRELVNTLQHAEIVVKMVHVLLCGGSILTARRMPTGPRRCAVSLCWVRSHCNAGSWCLPSVIRATRPTSSRRCRKCVPEWECQLTSHSCKCRALNNNNARGDVHNVVIVAELTQFIW